MAQVFANRRMAALLFLGFASGLPFVLTTDNLKAWMTDRGVDVVSIGLTSLVGLPYIFKFLWAPVMDRYVPPILGRRRGWLLITQIALIAVMLCLAAIGARASIHLLMWMAFVLAFCSASQDVVADAYRTDVLPPQERGAGTAIWVTGWRLAIVAAGAGSLMAVEKLHLSWPMVYALAAALMGIGLIATLLAPEPQTPGHAPPTLQDAVVLPMRDLLLRERGLVVLLFVILFKLPEVLASNMTLRFMLDIGISKFDIGAVRQGLGIAVTIVGAMAGGVLVAKIGLWRSLWVIGIMGAVSNAGFWVLSQTGPARGVMVAVVCIENFCAGMVTAAFVAFLMSRCSPEFSATQFAVLSGVMRLTDAISGPPAGWFVQKAGWPAFFMVSIVAGLPALMLLPLLKEGDIPASPLAGPEAGSRLDFPQKRA